MSNEYPASLLDAEQGLTAELDDLHAICAALDLSDPEHKNKRARDAAADLCQALAKRALTLQPETPDRPTRNGIAMLADSYAFRVTH